MRKATKDHGQRTTDHGGVKCGQWSMVYGLWSMIYGLFSVVYGQWSVVSIHPVLQKMRNFHYYIIILMQVLFLLRVNAYSVEDIIMQG